MSRLMGQMGSMFEAPSPLAFMEGEQALPGGMQGHSTHIKTMTEEKGGADGKTIKQQYRS